MEEKQKKASGLEEVTKELVGWEDNKLFRTLHYLTTRPGQLIKEYCRGEKSKYLPPVVYFFGVTALESYLVSVSGFLDFMLKKNQEDWLKMASDPAFAKLGVNASSVIENQSTVLSFMMNQTGQKLILIPILLLFAWLFYKKYNRSFKENSWFALYTTGHATLLTIPFILYWYFTRDFALYAILNLLVASVYWVWASKQFYLLTIGKAILLRVLMLTVVMLIMASVQPIILLISIMSNR